MIAIFAALAAVKSLLIICPPNRVAIISGRSRQLSDGRTVGYRVIKGGRTLRVPLLEKVSWVELNTMPIEVSVTNAFSKGAIPLNVQGIANVKVSSNEGLLSNSVERFLNTDQMAIAKIAKETLEANLRGVLATMTPEEVNEDRLKFSQTLIEEADDDVKTLGLELDTLKIQNVTDEIGYLESVGRRRTAEVLKSARVAEAERSAESEEAESHSRQRAEIAAANADLQIVVEQNALRVRTAELEAVAAAREAEAKVAGDKARVVAQQSLEQERIALEQKRLEADVVAPARAALEASQLAAQAEAATIIEDGKAQVEVFERLVAQYHAAGDDAQRIFVLNMLPDLVDRIASTVEGVTIDRISVIDSGGQGSGIPGVLGQLPAAVINLAEQMETATGVDILGALRSDNNDQYGDRYDEDDDSNDDSRASSIAESAPSRALNPGRRSGPSSAGKATKAASTASPSKASPSTGSTGSGSGSPSAPTASTSTPPASGGGSTPVARSVAGQTPSPQSGTTGPATPAPPNPSTRYGAGTDPRSGPTAQPQGGQRRTQPPGPGPSVPGPGPRPIAGQNPAPPAPGARYWLQGPGD